MSTRTNVSGFRLATVSFGCGFLLGLGAGMSEAIAQINPDSTLGIEQSIVNTTGTVNGQPAIVIEGGAIRGVNLLHSFTDFSVGDAQRVYFDHTNGINYVIARVTGGNPSEIRGALGVANGEFTGGADLFLINPNGIIFGPDSTLDLGGSFIATTAESVVFSNGETFSSTSLDVPSLTINLPISLRFGNRAEQIQVDGVQIGPNVFPRLSVELERTLALIGGDLEIMSGDISATHGQISLGSVAPTSTVDLTPITTGWIFDYSNALSFQDIRFLGGGIVASNGGNIQVQARNLSIEERAYFDLSPTPAQASGSLVIETSSSVQLRDNGTTLFLENGGFAQDVGSVEIRTSNLLLDSGTSIRSTTSGNSRAGDISIYAQNFDLIDSEIRSESFPNSTQEAGDINLFVQNLDLQSGSRISAATASVAAGGDVSIHPLQSGLPSAINIDGSSRITTDTFGAGSAGNIILDATSVSLNNQSRVTAAEWANSQGGSILLENVSTLNLLNDSRITTEAVSGQGGNIDIRVSGPILLNSGSRITSEATVNGNAGGVSVRSNSSLELQDFSRITVESVDGQGGALDVTADSISLRNNSRITSEATGTGSAGDITLTSEVVTLFDRSRITAATQSLTGGNITFRNQALIFMGPCEQGSCPAGNNAITASAAGTANGGNIAMIFRPEGGLLYSPLPLRPTNNDVIASAVSGNGGTITIQNLIALDPRRRNPVTGQPDPLHFVQFSGVATPDSDLIASSAFGVDGTVELNFRQDLESDDLPSEFLGNELEQSCTTGGEPRQSRSGAAAPLPLPDRAAPPLA
jgi:filamentous hemagglutinin family protein